MLFVLAKNYLLQLDDLLSLVSNYAVSLANLLLDPGKLVLIKWFRYSSSDVNLQMTP